MQLSKKKVLTIVVLAVFAIGGLLTLQYSLFMNTIVLKEQIFKRNVFAAMNLASEQLEEADMRNRFFIFDTLDARSPRAHHPANRGDSANVMTFWMTTDRSAKGRNDVTEAAGQKRKEPKTAISRNDTPFVVTAITQSPGGLSARADGHRITYTLDKPRRVTVRAFDVFGHLDTILVDGMNSQGEHDIPISGTRLSNGMYYVEVRTDHATATLRWERGKGSYSLSTDDNQLQKVTAHERGIKGQPINRVIESLCRGTDATLRDRLSSAIVDTILRTSLAAQAITLPFEYGILRNDSLELATTSVPKTVLLKSEYNAQLLFNEPFHTPETLYLYFPTYRSYVLGELYPELGLSLLLAGVLIFCFVYTIRTIFRQKEFAGRLSDFINNMTHEFKTPISTIALASEALARPEVYGDESRLQRYNGIVADEITRMKRQVEKILQMAALEEGEYELTLTTVDVHQLIRGAAENIALQLNARGGRITMQLNAVESTIRADALHIQNVLHNVLDNAMKYSESKPEISVETLNEEGMFVIRVRDNGIGISAENLSKVFDKYYRVPTGNLHDVKGFGLGLSYVKLVTDAHHGHVSITSEQGKGSTVQLQFPLLSEGRESPGVPIHNSPSDTPLL